MAGETLVTIVGNLTADPELRFTQSGAAVANFTIASTPRTFDRQAGEWKDGDPLFIRCSVWREYAENVAESLAKGSRVIAQGFLKMRPYEDREGNKRTSTELDVQEVGPALRFATARVQPAQSNGGGGQGGGFRGGGSFGGQQGGSQQDDPWGGSPAGGGGFNTPNDEHPF